MILLGEKVSLTEGISMSRTAKTTEFLKECMADSLLKLMKNKGIEKITVDEITKEAGVGRATWFRNFNSKNEAVTFKYIQLWLRWANEHNIAVRYRFSVDNAKDFFEFNYSIRNIHKTVYSANIQSALYDAFYLIMTPLFGANADECYQSRFFSYGLFGLLDEWIKRGFYESPQEMSAIFHNMIDKI